MRTPRIPASHQPPSRREFLGRAIAFTSLAALGTLPERLPAQSAGERPPQPKGVTVLNPRGRVPLSWIIDDSTCLVNLNKFAMPQFDAAHGGTNTAYHRDWRSWPDAIPDDFVRKFAEWSGEHGVKGKYSIVPYPACVGRLDGELPGWSPREVAASLELVRSRLMPHWDIHPEMVTHTRVIDLRTGHPFPDRSLAFMENWDWTTGKSADEIASYQAYALSILKNVGLPCEGVTTPGGYGSRARPQLAQATLESVRDVFGAQVPHYFHQSVEEGPASVAPRVELASGLGGNDPRCVVSVIACTGDWTGGWDNSEPGGADRYLTADGQGGRVAEILNRGEPACLLSHWTGIWWNGQERGFKIMQEVARRVAQRQDEVAWMKTADIARYWAAKELTRITTTDGRVQFEAPFATPAFTVRVPRNESSRFELVADHRQALREVPQRSELTGGTWTRDAESALLCFDLPKGRSEVLPGTA
jgi:hypothetical protein